MGTIEKYLTPKTNKAGYLARDSWIDTGGIRQHRKERFPASTFGGLRGAKEQADAWLRQREADRSRGVFFEPSREPFGTVVDRWVRGLDTTKRSPATIYCYRSAAKLRFTTIRSVPLCDITSIMIERLIDQWRAEKLTDTTINQARMVLRMVLEDALHERLIIEQPMNRVRRPLTIGRTRDTWTPEQVGIFLRSTRGDDEHYLWQLMFAALLRIGELAGLRWEDVDLENGRLNIRRTWTKDANGRVILGETTKTEAGTRTVMLPADVCHTLRMIRNERQGSDDGWVAIVRGYQANPSHIRYSWQRAVKQSGLPEITPHGARHAGATALIAAGVPTSIVQTILGHTDPAFTLRMYIHIRTEDTSKALTELSALYGITTQNLVDTPPASTTDDAMNEGDAHLVGIS